MIDNARLFVKGKLNNSLTPKKKYGDAMTNFTK
jgi:hypothetical protein